MKDAFAGPPAPPAGPEPDVDPRWSVLYEDSSLAVLDKSGNLPCHPSGRYREHTLEVLLKAAGWPTVHFVSRLDRETSGAVLVAKNPGAAARLASDMAAHRIRKTYLCIVEGPWNEEPGADGWCDFFGWIRPAGDDVVWRYRAFERAADFAAWSADRSATTARTLVRPLAWEAIGADPARNAGLTLLECRPVTGRTGQIRATLHDLGHPVAGDKLYGPDRAIYARMCRGETTAADRARLGRDRQALHAWKVAFRSPATREDVEIEAPPPPDFVRAVSDFAG